MNKLHLVHIAYLWGLTLINWQPNLKHARWKVQIYGFQNWPCLILWNWPFENSTNVLLDHKVKSPKNLNRHSKNFTKRKKILTPTLHNTIFILNYSNSFFEYHFLTTVPKNWPLWNYLLIQDENFIMQSGYKEFFLFNEIFRFLTLCAFTINLFHNDNWYIT